jgi:hypothetical protein
LLLFLAGPVAVQVVPLQHHWRDLQHHHSTHVPPKLHWLMVCCLLKSTSCLMTNVGLLSAKCGVGSMPQATHEKALVMLNLCMDMKANVGDSLRICVCHNSRDMYPHVGALAAAAMYVSLTVSLGPGVEARLAPWGCSGSCSWASSSCCCCVLSLLSLRFRAPAHHEGHREGQQTAKATATRQNHVGSTGGFVLGRTSSLRSSNCS